ncbi:TPA: Fic family protein [Salmonella enterica subsp. enterica]|uniref:Fic family protein n=1 Tax=Salmonella enterica TaxID=28901 RepID=UPI0038452570
MNTVECAKALIGKEDVTREEVEAVLDLSIFPVSPGGKYLHWSDILNRTASKQKALAVWTLLKTARAHYLETVDGLSTVTGASTTYMSTAQIMKTLSLADRHCTTAGLHGIQQSYGLHDTIFNVFADEESIASSQMEGAATTRSVAKKMLQEGRQPRNESESMIVANQRLMVLAWESRFENLTRDLLLQFHVAASQGIDDDKYHPGEIRTTDDIYVEGRDGEKVHQPPAAASLSRILTEFIRWVNIDHASASITNKKSNIQYMHPLIKACIMHFCLGFIHPFRDGNGRVARALCYWQLFRSGYEAFRYISISRLLKEAPIKYGEAYLKTETDSMDLTYFIDYQCSIFERAITGILEHARTSADKLRDLDNWMFITGIHRNITGVRQLLINSAICMPDKTFTIKEFAEKAGISPSTARNHLEAMVSAGVFVKVHVGGARPDHYAVKQQSTDKLKKAISKLIK